MRTTLVPPPAHFTTDRVKICALFLQYVTQSNLCILQQYWGDPWGMWNALQTVHERNTAGTRMMWLEKSVVFKLESNDILLELNWFEEKAEKLTPLITPLLPLSVDKILPMVVSIALPDSYLYHFFNAELSILPKFWLPCKKISHGALSLLQTQSLEKLKRCQWKKKKNAMKVRWRWKVTKRFIIVARRLVMISRVVGVFQRKTGSQTHPRLISVMNWKPNWTSWSWKCGTQNSRRRQTSLRLILRKFNLWTQVERNSNFSYPVLTLTPEKLSSMARVVDSGCHMQPSTVRMSNLFKDDPCVHLADGSSIN